MEEMAMNWNYLLGAIIVCVIVVEIIWYRYQTRRSRSGVEISQSTKSHPKHMLKTAAFYLGLTLLTAIPVVSIFLVAENSRKSHQTVELFAAEVEVTSEILSKRNDDLFASIQATKLAKLADSIKLGYNLMQIERLERLYIVGRHFVCWTDIWEIDTDQQEEFQVSYSFGTDHNYENEKFFVMIEPLEESIEARGIWPDTVNMFEKHIEYKKVEGKQDKKIVTLRIPVGANQKLRVRVDSHKEGWSNISPLSLIGEDLREFKHPPKTIDYWLYFMEEPIQVSALAINSNDIKSLIEDSPALSLHNALIERDSRIFHTERLAQAASEPKWLNWGFSSEGLKLIEDKSEYRYHQYFSTNSIKNFYGLSFWLSGDQKEKAIVISSMLK